MRQNSKRLTKITHEIQLAVPEIFTTQQSKRPSQTLCYCTSIVTTEVFENDEAIGICPPRLVAPEVARNHKASRQPQTVVSFQVLDAPP